MLIGDDRPLEALLACFRQSTVVSVRLHRDHCALLTRHEQYCNHKMTRRYGPEYYSTACRLVNDRHQTSPLSDLLIRQLVEMSRENDPTVEKVLVDLFYAHFYILQQCL